MPKAVWFYDIKPGSYRFEGRGRILSNPARYWEAKRPQFLRFYIGMNVGETPKWALEDVSLAVSKVLRKHVGKGDASFQTQRGVFTDMHNRVIYEDSALALVILPEHVRCGRLTELGTMMAADIAKELEQEQVIVEVWCDGRLKVTRGVYNPDLRIEDPSAARREGLLAAVGRVVGVFAQMFKI